MVARYEMGCAFWDSVVLRWMARARRPDGTIEYMCPRFRETGEADPRSDIYSLAATLYECLSGMNLSGLRSIPVLSSLVSAVSPELAGDIHRAMSPDPEDRHQSMDELLAVLRVHRERLRTADPPVRRPKHDDPTAPLGVAALTRMLDDFIQERATAGAALPTGGARSRDAVGQSPRGQRPIAAEAVEAPVPPAVEPAALPEERRFRRQDASALRVDSAITTARNLAG